MSTYFPYLEDKEFLKQLDEERYREIYIRIEVLDFTTERTIANIEGKSTGGSINLNGTSNMRRSGSLSMIVDPNGIDIDGESQDYYAITDVQNLISMNKKIRVFSGVRNAIGDPWSQYDIIWFPLGVYVIKSANASRNGGGINLSLTINDKCALLNGDMGGTIPAATIFSESELYNSAGTTRTVEPILIRDMVKRIVVEFGGEKPENVIIEDIPESIVKVIKWTGKDPLYLITTDGYKQYILKQPAEDSNLEYKTFIYGQDVGYMNEPFVYPGRLECNAGESAASVLDKLKNTLGNFEWFYDVHGRFHFQEIKNYLNTSLSTEILNLSESDYLMTMNPTMSSYTFDNHNIITSISNAPQYANIKNDFVVWGTRKTSTGVQKPIRYHLAFDDKPEPRSKPMEALVYEDYRGLQSVIKLDESNFGSIDVKYYEDETTTTKILYKKIEVQEIEKFEAYQIEFPLLLDPTNPEDQTTEYNEVSLSVETVETVIEEKTTNIETKIEKKLSKNGSLSIGKIDTKQVKEETIDTKEGYFESDSELSDDGETESYRTYRSLSDFYDIDYSIYIDFWGYPLLSTSQQDLYYFGDRLDPFGYYSYIPLFGINFSLAGCWNLNNENFLQIDMSKLDILDSYINSLGLNCYPDPKKPLSSVYLYTNILYTEADNFIENHIIVWGDDQTFPREIKCQPYQNSDGAECAILIFNFIEEDTEKGRFLIEMWNNIEDTDFGLSSGDSIFKIYAMEAQDNTITRYPYLNSDGNSELTRGSDKKIKEEEIEITETTYSNLTTVADLNKDSSKKYYLASNSTIWAWDNELNTFREFPNYKYCKLLPHDWRTELYFQGLEANDKTFSRNYYAAELNAEWPKICDVLGGTPLKDVTMGDSYESAYWPDQKADQYEFWLDFIEASDFSVNNIGRRVKVITDNNSNCLFPTEVPNYIIIEADGDVASERELAEKKGQEVIQVSPSVFKNLSLGGSQNAAFNKIKELLNTHTQYNESVTLSVIPIYYLEPNTRITINDTQMGIQGDYLIKTISLPLTASGTSNISCTKALSNTI